MARPSIEEVMAELARLTCGYVELTAWPATADRPAHHTASGQDGHSGWILDAYETLAQYADEVAVDGTVSGANLRALAARCREPATPAPAGEAADRELVERVAKVAEGLEVAPEGASLSMASRHALAADLRALLAARAPAGEAVDPAVVSRLKHAADILTKRANASAVRELRRILPGSKVARSWAADIRSLIAARAPSAPEAGPSEADWIAERDQAIRDAEARGEARVLAKLEEIVRCNESLEASAKVDLKRAHENAQAMIQREAARHDEARARTSLARSLLAAAKGQVKP